MTEPRGFGGAVILLLLNEKHMFVEKYCNF